MVKLSAYDVEFSPNKNLSPKLAARGSAFYKLFAGISIHYCRLSNNPSAIGGKTILSTQIHTWDVFFNRLNFRKTVIEQRGSAYNTTNLNPEEKENGNKIAQDRVDKFFQLMSPDGNTGTNSFKTIKKCIDDPAQTNIVHYLNNDYLTFVFNSEQIDEYFKYVKQKFYLPFDYIYSQEATLTYDESKEVEIEGTSYTNKSNFNWMVKEPYHLFDNYYAMAIDGIVSKRDYENLLSGDMHYFVNKLIEDFSTFDFDWNTYPGNLYVGSVCKILS